MQNCRLTRSAILHRFVTDGDERSAGEAEAAAQEEAPAADPNLYQKCYDYYINFYRDVTWILNFFRKMSTNETMCKVPFNN